MSEKQFDEYTAAEHFAYGMTIVGLVLAALATRLLVPAARPAG